VSRGGLAVSDLPPHMQAEAREKLAQLRKVQPPAAASRVKAPLSVIPTVGWCEVIMLALPMPPRLTNSSKGRSRNPIALNREKKAYWALLDGYVRASRIPKPPPLLVVAARLTWTLEVASQMDDNGACARVKWPEDCLVRREYLATDKPPAVRWSGLPAQVVGWRATYSLNVTITSPVSAREFR
jgi:hypothetical protein